MVQEAEEMYEINGPTRNLVESACRVRVACTSAVLEIAEHWFSSAAELLW